MTLPTTTTTYANRAMSSLLFVPPTVEHATRYDAWPPHSCGGGIANHNHHHNEPQQQPILRMQVYDWSQPTVQMYKATTMNDGDGCDNNEPAGRTTLDHHLVWPAPVRTERQKLDYSYHNLLIYSRLVFQDSILTRIRGSAATVEVAGSVAGSACDTSTSHRRCTSSTTTTNSSATTLRTASRNHHNEKDPQPPEQPPEQQQQQQQQQEPTHCPPDQQRPSAPANNHEPHRQRPWLIFTAGPMGVGKGYVLAQLQQMQVLDVRQYILIDPDMIKTTLPEMAGYEHDHAATLLHAESCAMADVLFEHALAHSYNVMVDGSLRNVAYYQHLLQHRIRTEFGHYRVAILHVTAAATTIRQRAVRRTGRVVPIALVEESIVQVPRSVTALTPLVDVVHVIRNDDNDDDRPANDDNDAATARQRGPISRLRLEKSIMMQQPQGRRRDQEEESCDDAVTTTSIPPTMVEIMNPTWESFAASWQQASDVVGHNLRHCRPPLDVTMDDTFYTGNNPNQDDTTTTTNGGGGGTTTASDLLHRAAAEIWQQSYPNFCPRCTLRLDRQCGICRHGRHRCACLEC